MHKCVTAIHSQNISGYCKSSPKHARVQGLKQLCDSNDRPTHFISSCCSHHTGLQLSATGTHNNNHLMFNTGEAWWADRTQVCQPPLHPHHKPRPPSPDPDRGASTNVAQMFDINLVDFLKIDTYLIIWMATTSKQSSCVLWLLSKIKNLCSFSFHLGFQKLTEILDLSDLGRRSRT